MKVPADDERPVTFNAFNNDPDAADAAGLASNV